MSAGESVVSHLVKWRSALEAAKHFKGRPLLAIAGPSGVGKSTLVNALASHSPIFRETVEDNPYLPKLLAGRIDQFDAAANQQWFLTKISGHIEKADPQLSLVLDQDPAAIVFTYSRMWLNGGHISQSAFSGLVESLIELENLAARWQSPRITLLLDAPAEVLHQRVSARDGKNTPPVDWFRKARTSFHELQPYFPNARTVSTVESTPSRIFQLALGILREHRESP